MNMWRNRYENTGRDCIDTDSLMGDSLCKCIINTIHNQ